MKLHLSSLRIECRNGNIVIPFSDGISVFYGNAGVGKTTLLNLVNYALGQDLVKTKTVSSEILAVHLDAFISGTRVLVNRKIGSNQMMIHDDNGNHWYHAKYVNNGGTFSDYLYSINCCEPLAMIRNKTSVPIRVTFANFIWFSYLRQDELDNTFFYLGESNMNFKSYASAFVLKSLLIDDPYSEVNNLRKVNYIKEKQTVLRQKLSLLEEIMGATSLARVDMNKEIVDKQRLAYQLKCDIDELRSAAEVNDLVIENIIKKSYDSGRYDAESIYLKEFNKFNILATGYKNEICKLDKELINFDINNREKETVYAENIKDLEQTFADCLKKVSFPDMEDTDSVRIDTSSMIPSIVSISGREKYNYTSISSGGIRTIYKICFAVAIHIYATKHNTNSILPNILMIDTPMKNISERTDSGIYDSLYHFLFDTFGKGGRLEHCQLVIVDKECPKVSTSEKILFREFSRENPLIPDCNLW